MNPYTNSDGSDTRYTQLQKIGTSTGGRNPIEEQEFKTLQSQMGIADPASGAASTATFNQQAQGKQNDFLSRFKAAIGGQETLPDMASRIGGTLGLPQLQANSQSLQNTLFNLPTTYSKATTGRDVNANQLARLIGQKQSELAPAASLASQNTLNAQSNLATQLGYGVQQQQKELKPFETEGSMLSDQLAREFSGFTQDKQNQFDMMMQQMANGQALSMQQLQQANDIAKIKLQYDQTKNDADQYFTLGQGDRRYDNNGKLIANNPAAAKVGAVQKTS